MDNLIRKPTLLLTLLLLGIFPLAIAQQFSDDLHTKFSTADQKKIIKADEINSKAAQLSAEADQILDDAKKAESKRLEASKLFHEAALIKYNVYEDNAKTFWKKFTGDKFPLEVARKAEAEAADSFKIADGIRKSVSKQKKFEDKLPLLVKAEAVEANALLKMQKTLYTYVNWPVSYNQNWIFTSDISVPKPSSSAVKSIEAPKQAVPQKPIVKHDDLAGNDSSIYGIVKVNEEQIDMFNEFLKKSYPAEVENYVINYRELDYSDVNKLRAAWDMYQHGIVDSTLFIAQQATPEDTVLQDVSQTAAEGQAPVSPDKPATSTASDIPGSKSIQASTSSSEKLAGRETAALTGNRASKPDMGTSPTQTKQTAVSSSSNVTTPGKNTVSEKTAVSTKVVKPATSTKSVVAIDQNAGAENSGFVYRVQIVACRVQLDEKTLRGIYNGTEEILELQEENWYKYAIGTYSTYKAARQFVNQSKIPGAFVIAYLNGKRIKITPAVAFRSSAASETSGLRADLVEFRIQIAASKAKISDNLLSNIYSGSQSIDVITEEGWYKYSIAAGKTFDQAKSLLKQVNVPGAFIVAYHQNTKIDLPIAIKLTRQ